MQITSTTNQPRYANAKNRGRKWIGKAKKTKKPARKRGGKGGAVEIEYEYEQELEPQRL